MISGRWLIIHMRLDLLIDSRGNFPGNTPPLVLLDHLGDARSVSAAMAAMISWHQDSLDNIVRRGDSWGALAATLRCQKPCAIFDCRGHKKDRFQFFCSIWDVVSVLHAIPRNGHYIQSQHRNIKVSLADGCCVQCSEGGGCAHGWGIGITAFTASSQKSETWRMTAGYVIWSLWVVWRRKRIEVIVPDVMEWKNEARVPYVVIALKMMWWA
jgi:hypothetical protein